MMTVRSTPWMTALASTFTGELLAPGEDGYDQARQVHNGMIDKRPALIARCRSVADAVDVVRAAREAGAPLAIRGGGHNVAGLATVDAGIVLDLSLLKGIYVDPLRRRARVEGGVLWRELNRATQLHGLATTGGSISTTGVAGLTLGGGLGWLMGRHGLALDNLVSAQVVTAAAEVIDADETRHGDLFWALRGAGANFGVVTSFEFALHPIGPQVMGGLIAYPLPAAPEVLRFYRELTADLPDEASLVAALTYAPDGSGTPIVALALCHTGAPADGERLAQRIKQFGRPAIDHLGPIAYEAQNQMLDAAFPRGTRNYWKARFLDTLSDRVLDDVAAAFASCPVPLSAVIIEHLHGAVTRRPADATAFPHRSPGFSILTMSQWSSPADDARGIAWAQAVFQATAATPGCAAYVNYLDADDTHARVAAAYGANLPRLREIKRRYDPANLFRVNHNISP